MRRTLYYKLLLKMAPASSLISGKDIGVASTAPLALQHGADRELGGDVVIPPSATKAWRSAPDASLERMA